MTVQELIDRLNRLNTPDLEVVIEADSGFYPAATAEPTRICTVCNREVMESYDCTPWHHTVDGFPPSARDPVLKVLIS